MVAQSLNLKDSLTMNLPWIDSPFFEQLLAESTLDEVSKKFVKDFAENGYAIIDPEIEDFEQLTTEVIAGLHPEYHRLKVSRLQDAWTYNQAVKKIALAPKVLSSLRLLYQRKPIPFQTLNFFIGTQQKTHSDAIHFQSVPARFMCGVWVALEDVDEQNGPLHYYPGSHKLPVYDLQDLGLNSYNMAWEDYYLKYENFIESLVKAQGLQKVDICLRKGQAIIWSANLLHGGSIILNGDRTRHSQVTHFFFSDCMYYTPMASDPFLKRIYFRNVTNIATGEIVPHRYNGVKIDVDSLGNRELVDFAISAHQEINMFPKKSTNSYQLKSNFSFRETMKYTLKNIPGLHQIYRYAKRLFIK